MFGQVVKQLVDRAIRVRMQRPARRRGGFYRGGRSVSWPGVCLWPWTRLRLLPGVLWRTGQFVEPRLHAADAASCAAMRSSATPAEAGLRRDHASPSRLAQLGGCGGAAAPYVYKSTHRPWTASRISEALDADQKCAWLILDRKDSLKPRFSIACVRFLAPILHVFW